MPQCTAPSRRSGEQCKNYAMKGKSKCRFHGGKSTGAPKGSKNALKTGEHETITLETMFQDEIIYANSVSLDPMYTLKSQLMLLKVREMRMLKRIKKILDGELAAGKNIIGEAGENGETYSNMVTIGGTKVKTSGIDGDSTSFSLQSETHSQNYLRLEAALGNIQDQIGRTVERIEKIRLMSSDDENSEPKIIEFKMINGSKNE